MKILLISNIYPPGFIGGYELGAFEIATGLAARGHSVEVLTSDFFADDVGPLESEIINPTVTRSLECPEITRSVSEATSRRNISGFFIYRNLRILASKIKTENPDVILSFNLAGLGAPSILQMISSCGMRPVVYFMDHIFATMCADASRKDSYERVFPPFLWVAETEFVFMSESLSHEVLDALWLKPQAVSIVPGWVGDKEPVHLKDRSSDAVTKFVFASRIGHHKGVDSMMEAARKLLDNGLVGFTVDVFGSGDVSLMLQRMTALGLRKHVFYQGSVPKDELIAKFQNYDALLFPSLNREPFGFVVPEAAIAGCIPVMSNGVGAAEWYLDGSDCLKIAQGPDSLCTAMSKVIKMSAVQRTAMRKRAQTTTYRFLKFDTALDKLEQILQRARGPARVDPRIIENALTILGDVWRRDDA